MNKKLKFKCWDKRDGIMKEVAAINFYFKQVVFNDIVRQFEEVVLLEYTGILDKHGKEIYENDYIKNIKTGKIYKVVWNGSLAAFEICDMENQYKSIFFTNRTFGDYEIVGNAYKNKLF